MNCKELLEWNQDRGVWRSEGHELGARGPWAAAGSGPDPLVWAFAAEDLQLLNQRRQLIRPPDQIIKDVNQ